MLHSCSNISSTHGVDVIRFRIMRSVFALTLLLAAAPSCVHANGGQDGSHKILDATAPSRTLSYATTSRTQNLSTAATGHTYTGTAASSLNCSASWDAWMSSNFSYYELSTFYSTYTYHNITAQITTYV